MANLLVSLYLGAGRSLESHGSSPSSHPITLDTGRLRQCHGDSFYLDLVVVKAVSSGQLIPDLVVFKASCGGPPFVSLSEKSNTEVIQTQDGDMEFGRYTRIRWLT